MLKKALRYLGASIAIALPVAFILFFSEADYRFYDANSAVLKLSIKHAGHRMVECDEIKLLKDEAERYREMIKETSKARMKLKKLGSCSRGRNPVYVELYADERLLVSGLFEPGGWTKDGASFVYGKYAIAPGKRHVIVKMRDSGHADSFDYSLDEEVEFEAGRLRVVKFDEIGKRLLVQ